MSTFTVAWLLYCVTHRANSSCLVASFFQTCPVTVGQSRQVRTALKLWTLRLSPVNKLWRFITQGTLLGGRYTGDIAHSMLFSRKTIRNSAKLTDQRGSLCIYFYTRLVSMSVILPTSNNQHRYFLHTSTNSATFLVALQIFEQFCPKARNVAAISCRARNRF